MEFRFGVVIADGLKIESPLFDMPREEPAGCVNIDFRIENIALIDPP